MEKLNRLCVRKVLASISNNDRCAFTPSGLLCWYAEVIVGGGAGAGGGAVAPEALWVIQVLQSVAGQGICWMLVQVGPRVCMGGIEGRSWCWGA